MREGGPPYSPRMNHSAALLKVTVGANVSNNIPVASMKGTDPGDRLSPATRAAHPNEDAGRPLKLFSRLATCCDDDCNELSRGKPLKKVARAPLVQLMMSQ